MSVRADGRPGSARQPVAPTRGQSDPPGEAPYRRNRFLESSRRDEPMPPSTAAVLRFSDTDTNERQQESLPTREAADEKDETTASTQTAADDEYVAEPPRVSRIPLPQGPQSKTSSSSRSIPGRLAAASLETSAVRREIQRGMETLAEDVGGRGSEVTVAPERSTPLRSDLSSAESPGMEHVPSPAESTPSAPPAAAAPLQREAGRSGNVSSDEGASPRQGTTGQAADQDQMAQLPSLPSLSSDAQFGDASSSDDPGEPDGQDDGDSSFLSSLPQTAAPSPEDRLAEQATAQPQALTSKSDGMRTTAHGPPSFTDSSASEPSAASARIARADIATARIVPNELRANTQIALTVPRFTARLVGPGEVVVGQPTDYRLVVTNEDAGVLSNVIIELPMPEGIRATYGDPTHGTADVVSAEQEATRLQWRVQELGSGQIASLPLRLIAISPHRFDMALQCKLEPFTGVMALDVQSPQLEMQLSGPQRAEFRIPANYLITLRNTGKATAKDVRVELDAQPYGKSHAVIDEIAPGDQQTLELALTFEKAGMVTLLADAVVMGRRQASSKLEVAVSRPVLSAKISTPPVAHHSSEIPCVVVLENRGDAPARELLVELSLPPAADLSALPSAGDLEIRGHTVVKRLELLPGGEQVSMQLPLRLTAEGEHLASVKVTDATGSSAEARSVTHVQAVVDLKLQVTDPMAPAPVGTPVVYELQVANRGSKAAENVRVIAQFSEGIEPTSGDGHPARVVPGQVLFSPIERIAPGETRVLKVQAVAQQGGVHRFRAEVRGEEDIRLVQEESTRFLQIASEPGELR